MITANNVLITSKASKWELLINYFKQHYGNERTAADNLKRPLLPVVTQWVKMAWDEIDPGIITKSFKKCFISNDLDGTEDAILWDEQHDKSDTNSDEEGDDMCDVLMTHE